MNVIIGYYQYTETGVQEIELKIKELKPEIVQNEDY